MDLKKLIEENICNYIFSNYELKVSYIEIQSTRKEYKGDITVVIFPLIKLLKKSPLELGSEIGDHLLSEIKLIENYNVIHGFLNLNISNNHYIQLLKKVISQKKYGISEPNEDSPLYLVEFSVFKKGTTALFFFKFELSLFNSLIEKFGRAAS